LSPGARRGTQEIHRREAAVNEPRSQTNLFAGASEDGIEVVDGTVDRITFRADDTGYTVARIARDGEEKTFAAVGKMPPLAAGERVRATGRWVEHAKFGRQLQVASIEKHTPKTTEALVRYLGSGMAKGIGPKLAERIVRTFGEDTLEVLEHRAEELIRIPGISPEKARNLVEAVRDNARLRDLTLLLEEHGLGSNYAGRIHERYGDSALLIVREEPYRLARDIWGIGFARADALARHLGVEADDPARVEAGLTHTLRRSSELGDVYLAEEDLVRAAAELLQLDWDVVERGVREAVDGGRVIRESDRIYTHGLHRAEVSATERLRELRGAGGVNLPFASDSIVQLQRERDLALSNDQIEALRLAHERGVVVITGGPGTGKTTLTRFLLDLLDAHQLRLALAAPTGRAARRLSEATGREAVTLHRLLGFDPSTNSFGRDASHPVEADVVLVDESSMVDLRLFDVLLGAITPGTRLILVGDADQLPSVGPGEVLRDLIRSGEIPVARLSHVFRQEHRSGIVLNAHRVLAGDPLELADLGESDFVFIERDEPSAVAAEIRRVVGEWLPRQAGIDVVRDVQVLVPMYKGDAGADALNRALQDDLNADGTEVTSGHRRFRVGDRVIQLKNDYQRGVFNGEIGRVDSVSEDGRDLLVQFDTLVPLAAGEWDQIALAYAITVHKAQGSEYEWVVMPLSTQHAILLDRPLFYTAITRAKKGVILVGSRRALALALRAGRTRERRTTLAARLRQEIPSA
jgi:exodeoxyribonuclease V alpha subunit